MMKKILSIAALAALTTACGAPDDLGTARSAQVPINDLEAGVWEWTLVTPGITWTGHVIVRGTNAGTIGSHGFAQGTETWYYDGTSSGGTASFQLELLHAARPSDTALVSAVDAIVEAENELGSEDMVPSWQSAADPDSDAPVFTLVDVDGPGSYGSLYENVSFQMIDPSAEMPTFYTNISNLYSIVGGSSTSVPVDVGTVAAFAPVTELDSGYPDSSWTWFGYDGS